MSGIQSNGGANENISPHINPEVLKIQEKEQKQKEKSFAKDAKVEAKSLSKANSAATSEIKAEKKALKKKLCAEKALTKATAKQTKYTKGLERQQAKVDGAISNVHKAQIELNKRIEDHNKHIQAKAQTGNILQHTQALKEQHDLQREASLANTVPPPHA